MKFHGFHLEPTNRCVLKCSACERTQFREQFGTQHWRNTDLNIEHLQSFVDIDVQGTVWELCGNTGDPIYHPELHKLVAWIKSRGGRVCMTTNGSYKEQDWWKQLLELMDHTDTIIFSVDGSPNTSPIYRINSDWLSIDLAMSMVANSSVTGVWKMIPFVFNEHEIKLVKTLSANAGLEFRLEPSERFEDNDPLAPKTVEFVARYGTGAMAPRCSDGTRHYITAGGFYTPCCWSARYSFYYKSEFYKERNNYDISKTTLSQVLARMENYDERMKVDPQAVCSYTCRQT